MSRLIVVSNRVTPIQGGKPAAGGLAVAIQEALEETGGLWFGWNGGLAAQPETSLNITRIGHVELATVGLLRRDQDEYYRGFSNSTLWPLFHYRMNLIDQRPWYYKGYLRVNEFFARMLKQFIGQDDLVWVHDYHLIPLAQALRAQGHGNAIGFFLHIPFPPPDILLACTQHEELVRQLCTYDVVGFQTEADLFNFTSYIRRYARGQVHLDGTIKAFGHTLKAAAFPIGIDTDTVAVTAAEAALNINAMKLVRSLIGRGMLLGADRLDYSKGLDNRFLAYERLLETHPEARTRVTYVQIAPPSRSDVATYREIRQSLEGLAGRINGRYTEVDWVPLRYLNKSFARSDLLGFMRRARIGLVTPLRDGMNLVAKEYVAAQDPEAPGALVLSAFAGAAQELDGAVIVNPYDIDSIATGMHTALIMPEAERKERWDSMMVKVRENNVSTWRNNFLAALARPRPLPRRAANG